MQHKVTTVLGDGKKGLLYRNSHKLTRAGILFMWVEVHLHYDFNIQSFKFVLDMTYVATYSTAQYFSENLLSAFESKMSEKSL